ncbi:hypothetical protein [Natrinema altunense]|nr:hypothetical protein [Natrinema altunense]
MSQEEQNEDLQELPRWLLDAPHFIDDKRINSFYDAVIRPKAKIEESITITVQKEDVKEIKKEFGIGIEIQPPDIVNMVTPFLRAGGGQTGSYTRFGRRKNEIRLNEINTPQRQLIQLLLQYFIKHPDRIGVVQNRLSQDGWYVNPERIRKPPKQLILLDLPPKNVVVDTPRPETMLIPTSAEFTNGEIVKLYTDDRFQSAYQQREELKKKGRESWKPFLEAYDPLDATEVIEDTISGKIEWINYRLPLNKEGKTAQIRFSPSGEYHNGDFAYNLVYMGHKHGLRIVGTVQSEPEINVLAAYRK